MDEIKKIEDYYKQLMEVALGKKGAAPKGGEAGEGMAQNPAKGAEPAGTQVPMGGKIYTKNEQGEWEYQ